MNKILPFPCNLYHLVSRQTFYFIFNMFSNYCVRLAYIIVTYEQNHLGREQTCSVQISASSSKLWTKQRHPNFPYKPNFKDCSVLMMKKNITDSLNMTNHPNTIDVRHVLKSIHQKALAQNISKQFIWAKDSNVILVLRSLHKQRT